MTRATHLCELTSAWRRYIWVHTNPGEVPVPLVTSQRDIKDIINGVFSLQLPRHLCSSLTRPHLCFLSGSSRSVPVKASRWATNCGWHASCCTASARTLALWRRWIPNPWRATGTAPAATPTSAPSRWGRREDWSKSTLHTNNEINESISLSVGILLVLLEIAWSLTFFFLSYYPHGSTSLCLFSQHH